jgi:hypothetical protein
MPDPRDPRLEDLGPASWRALAEFVWVVGRITAVPRYDFLTTSVLPATASAAEERGLTEDAKTALLDKIRRFLGWTLPQLVRAAADTKKVDAHKQAVLAENAAEYSGSFPSESAFQAVLDTADGKFKWYSRDRVNAAISALKTAILETHGAIRGVQLRALAPASSYTRSEEAGGLTAEDVVEMRRAGWVLAYSRAHNAWLLMTRKSYAAAFLDVSSPPV